MLQFSSSVPARHFLTYTQLEFLDYVFQELGHLGVRLLPPKDVQQFFYRYAGRLLAERLLHELLHLEEDGPTEVIWFQFVGVSCL